jgi:hypothetical protein
MSRYTSSVSSIQRERHGNMYPISPQFIILNKKWDASHLRCTHTSVVMEVTKMLGKQSRGARETENGDRHAGSGFINCVSGTGSTFLR